MKVEFVSVDEENKHYSLRTEDGKVYFGREYLDSCYMKPKGEHFERKGFDLFLDKEKAKKKLDKKRLTNSKKKKYSHRYK